MRISLIRQAVYRLVCLICVFVLCAPCVVADTDEEELCGKAASVYGYALNDEIVRYGVISNERNGRVIYNDEDGYPSGVIYADTVSFESDKTPNLVIFRADGENGCICADVFGYDADTLEAVAEVSLVKFASEDEEVSAEFSLGQNGSERYIIYAEYKNDECITSEYYTIINDTAFRYVSSPTCSEKKDIVNFNGSRIVPKTDLSYYNEALGDFFSSLKDIAADSVTYPEISGSLSDEETANLEKRLKYAAGYKSVNINKYDTAEDYNAALENRKADNVFYSLTDLYDLGDEIYYARFATNNAFYNYAVLRRSDAADDGYQILAVKTDSIPLSDAELRVFKNECMHNKLLLKKSKIDEEPDENAEAAARPLLNIPKIVNVPKPINERYRFPLAFIGGGVALALFLALWVTLSIDDKCGEQKEI